MTNQRHFIPRLNTAVSTQPESKSPMMNQFRVPQRLTAKNLLETLDNLGLDVTVLKAMAANADSEAQPTRFGHERQPSAHALDLKRVDAALAKTSLPVSEKIRLKYALDTRGLLKQ
jgi:hypothetical protein